MIRQHGFVGLLVASLVAGGSFGCGGDDDGGDGDGGGGGGETGEASISGVSPGDVFVGRGAEVLVVGNNTGWEDGVAVDFGAGVTVDEVVVASPTALMVSITA